MNEWMNKPSIKQTIWSQVNWKVGVSSIMYKTSYMVSKFLCPISSVHGWVDGCFYITIQLDYKLQWIAMNEPSIHQQTIWWQVNCKIGFSLIHPSIKCKLSHYMLSKNFKCPISSDVMNDCNPHSNNGCRSVESFFQAKKESHGWWCYDIGPQCYTLKG